MQKGSLWICLNNSGWIDLKTHKNTVGPAKDEIVTECGRLEGIFLVFEEYPGVDEKGEPHGYHINNFQKIQGPIEVNIEEIISEPQPI